jgi:GAF domain-containing protein/HAMP domain-containing protein
MSDVLRTLSSACRSALGRFGLLGSQRRSPDDRLPASAPRGRLFRKYVLLIVGLVSLVLLLNSALDFWFGYEENKAALFRIQQEKAGSAARRIEQFVDEIERQLGWTTAPQWAASPLEQRRFDYVRLLRQVPAITELIQLDDAGKEQLKVSRLAMDVVGSEKDYSGSPSFIEARQHRVWFSPVYFRKESEPYMTVALARAGRNAGVTVAEVNLKLIWDVITGLKIGQGGYAYVVDRDGRLIAHPDISLVLRNTDLSKLPQVAAALAQASSLPSSASGGGSGWGQPIDQAVMIAKGVSSGSVLMAHAPIAQLGWTVFVELPLREALAPLYGSALRTGGVVALALVLATLAALVLARRMTVPIRQLQAGAARIGAGELDRRIDIHTGDELEGLADDFNRMAADLQKSYADLEKKVEDRTAELKEALDQQTATAEVLQVINSSPGDLAPVFDAMLEKAIALCEAAFGTLATYDGEHFAPAAAYGVPLAFAAFRRERGAFAAPPGSSLDRVAKGEALVHVADVTTDPSQAATPLVKLGGCRALVSVALRRDESLIGAITVYRQEVRPFTDKQIALLKNFAAQAVIAMENARLMTETREALEQQTATAEVLGVINSSPGDLTPVFNAMLEKATRLCEAPFGILRTWDGERFHFGAVHGDPRFCDWVRQRGPIRPDRDDSLLGRIEKGELVVRFADARDEGLTTSPGFREMVEASGIRSAVTVALHKDDALLGIITVYRQEVRPFSDKQIALLQNFAAQAVIAMENARLITETREALEQQTATAEVLQVINSSPGDLAPVFDAILEKAHALCGAAKGSMVTYDGERYRTVATRGLSAAYAKLLREVRRELGASNSPPERLLRGESLVQISNLETENDPISRAAAELEGARTVLFVPLRKDGALLGYMTAYRQEVRLFSNKQIALLQNFAAQAVIAMENARLIIETREALEQQTATAEVLGIISSSPGRLEPVFDAMLANAVRICGGKSGMLALAGGGGFRGVAVQGVGTEFMAALSRIHHPPPQTGLDLLLKTRQTTHISDCAAMPAYDPVRAFNPAFAAVRTALHVPMLKERELLGAILVYRDQVLPFGDRQVELVENFAKQAVIAIENTRLITETREALEQQTATAEVLQVINSSPGDLAPVFDAMLEKAMRLCQAAFGVLWMFDGDRLVPAAWRGVPTGFAEFLSGAAMMPGPGTAAYRFMHGERSVIQNLDLADEEPYRAGDPLRRSLVDLGGARAALHVPLVRDNNVLGIVTIYRQEVRPFTDKQIALLQNFAAQAVIAMENARLITETREALEQQTATAEVLGVINSSPGDLAPVFDAMLDKAMRLCEAAGGALRAYDGAVFRAVAMRGVPAAFAEATREVRPHPQTGLGRVEHGERVVQIADLADPEDPRAETRSRRDMVELGGIRTSLWVALRKEETLLGTFVLYRKEVRPFTEKQIALVENFAAQAVIAMENARLITETREALEQQTATTEVLQVINSSPGDLTPVFDAMLEKAMNLCEAAFGGLWTFEQDRYVAVALRNVPAAYSEFLADTTVVPGPGTAPYRFLQGERIVHNFDLKSEEAYAAGDPQRRALVDLGGARTALQVPLRKDDHVLGVITIYRQEVRSFSDKQIALFQNFAAQAVIAMENARLITELRQRTGDLQESLEYQTATSEVLKVISQSGADLEPVLEMLVETAARLCDAEQGYVYRLREGRHHLAASFGLAAEFKDFMLRNLFGIDRGTLSGRTLLERRVVHIEDAANDPEYTWTEAQRRGNLRTGLGVPLLREDTLIGVLGFFRSRVEPFTEKQIALVTTFADQAVIAIENARLLGDLQGRTDDLQESLEYQTATSDVLKVISQSTFDLRPVLETLAGTASRLCEAEMAFIFRREGDLYRVAASVGFSPETKALVEANPITPGRGTVAGRAALTASVVHIPDARSDPEYTWGEFIRVAKTPTMLGVPLLREGVPVGVIVLARQRVEPFSDKQIELVRTFADQAVIAIENARLFNELRARTDELGSSVAELKMLGEVGQAVSSTLDLRTVLSTILNASLGVTWANAGAIFRYSRAERAFRLVEAVGWDAGLAHSIRDLRIAESETAMGEAVARRAPIQLADLAERPSAPLRDITLAAGFHSALIVPLVGAERIFGAITLMRQMAGEFPPESVRLMQTLASQSVLAIQNARLFREIADKSEQLALASQHKSQFLANMSHELRTPLNAILGYAELLVDGIYGVLPERPRGVLDRIQNNGKHLLALINDVLDLAKIEAGQLTLTLDDYSLPEVVQSVVTATEPLATSKGLKFTAAVQDELPMAHGDARRVSQVLLNLVGNAIKFTDKGEVEIRGIIDKGQFVLTVRDTGPGIPDADQERIFGEFQQIDNSNTRKKGGTGLGLAISKRMVEMQGGTISVDSVLGQGSTFRVVLPVHVDEMMEAA